MFPGEQFLSQGYSGSQINSRPMRHRDLGVAQNYKEALRWYIKASQEGHFKAQYNLGCQFAIGDGFSPDLLKRLYTL